MQELGRIHTHVSEDKMKSKREIALEELCMKMQELQRDTEKLMDDGYTLRWLFMLVGFLGGLMLGALI